MAQEFEQAQQNQSIERLEMRVTLMDGGRKIRLDQDIVVNAGKYKYTVPTGFVCDYASVPRLFWGVLPPMGVRYSSAAILHDYMYKFHAFVFVGTDDSGQVRKVSISRKYADQIFRDALISSSARWWRRVVMYRAVRLFGGKSWRKNNA